jgi:putative endonuclease
MFKRKLDEGNRGEEIATRYLADKGYKIIGRNFRIRGGEIDIIAIDSSGVVGNETLVFIEVKTRTSKQFGTGLEAITPWKLKAIMKTAEFYKMKYKNLPELMRIDAVIVMLDLNNNLLTIELEKNISS